MIGQELAGRYRILRKLGEGGIGQVFLVEHLELGRREALKLLHADMANAPEMVSRFRREARAINRLRHPNIISVYDFGQLPTGQMFLTTEYAEGERIDQLLRERGKLGLGQVLSLLTQLCDAVSHAHEHGVVHRDLKPPNMILVPHRGRGVLKILDFGMAKIICADYEESIPLSREDVVLGTPEYLAPEQLTGIRDHPSIDIYSIGCIAFELLVGRPPFVGRPMDVVLAHKEQAPTAPSDCLPDSPVPAEFDRLVLRCLAKRPEDRFCTVEELHTAVRTVPGYRARRTRSGYSAHRGLPALSRGPARTWRPVLNDYGDDEESTQTKLDERRKKRRAVATQTGETDEETSVDLPLTSGAALAETGQADALNVGSGEVTGTRLLNEDMARDRFHASVEQLAGALIDRGHNDVRMVMLLASLSNIQSTLEQFDAELEDLEERIDRVEQQAREREGALRFAIGELRFERQHAGKMEAAVRLELDHQLLELSRSLSECSESRERDVNRLVDRSVALTAERATVADTLATVMAELDGKVIEVSPHYAHNPLISVLVEAREQAREALSTVLLRGERPLGSRD